MEDTAECPNLTGQHADAVLYLVYKSIRSVVSSIMVYILAVSGTTQYEFKPSNKVRCCVSSSRHQTHEHCSASSMNQP